MTGKKSSTRIGIMGAGHLGLTLAEAFLKNVTTKENLFISASRNSDRMDVIGKLGLTKNLKSNESLCAEGEIVFIAVRPQSFKEFEKAVVNPAALFVSCMAGVSLASFAGIFGKNVCRMMTSGPATIVAKQAVVAIYPYNLTVANIMTRAGFATYNISNEQELHYFTVGVCLPAAIVRARALGISTDEASNVFNEKYSLFTQLFKWAEAVVPPFESAKQMELYVTKMATSGGVTEAIVNKLNESNNFIMALQAGTEKSIELSSMQL